MVSLYRVMATFTKSLSARLCVDKIPLGQLHHTGENQAQSAPQLSHPLAHEISHSRTTSSLHPTTVRIDKGCCRCHTHTHHTSQHSQATLEFAFLHTPNIELLVYPVAKARDIRSTEYWKHIPEHYAFSGCTNIHNDTYITYPAGCNLSTFRTNQRTSRITQYGILDRR